MEKLWVRIILALLRKPLMALLMEQNRPGGLLGQCDTRFGDGK